MRLSLLPFLLCLTASLLTDAAPTSPATPVGQLARRQAASPPVALASSSTSAITSSVVGPHAPTATGKQPGCTVLRVRKEWRTLTPAEKTAYLDAVVCLKRTPSGSTPYGGVRSVYDHFQAEHSAQSLKIHWAGPFLPWHSLFLAVYEASLRTHCGFNGTQPYWSWPTDVEAGSIEASELFDAELGFGGNGPFVPASDRPLPPPRFESPFLPPAPFLTDAERRAALIVGTGGGCVPDGRFSREAANWTVSLGPGNSTAYAPHCLRRDFDLGVLEAGSRDAIEEVLGQPHFGRMHYVLEGRLEGLPTIHASGHGGIGGEMNNVFSSPGDPLFYLHHANLDRVWRMWQARDLPGRLFEVDGNADSFDFDSTLRANVTAAFPIDLGLLHPSITLGELLDAGSPALGCYTYDDPPWSI